MGFEIEATLGIGEIFAIKNGRGTGKLSRILSDIMETDEYKSSFESGMDVDEDGGLNVFAVMVSTGERFPKLYAIKAYRTLFNLSLKEAKDAVDTDMDRARKDKKYGDGVIPVSDWYFNTICFTPHNRVNAFLVQQLFDDMSNGGIEIRWDNIDEIMTTVY